jgi:hypothetical protein
MEKESLVSAFSTQFEDMKTEIRLLREQDNDLQIHVQVLNNVIEQKTKTKTKRSHTLIRTETNTPNTTPTLESSQSVERGKENTRCTHTSPGYTDPERICCKCCICPDFCNCFTSFRNHLIAKFDILATQTNLNIFKIDELHSELTQFKTDGIHALALKQAEINSRLDQKLRDVEEVQSNLRLYEVSE